MYTPTPASLIQELSKISLPEGDLRTIYITDFDTIAQLHAYHKELPVDVIGNVSEIPHAKYLIDYWDLTFAIHYSHFYATDDAKTDIIQIAKEVYGLLKASDYQNVVIHCRAGISRSVSVVIFFMIEEYGWDFDEALSCIQLTRPMACPNEHFEHQLKEYVKTKKQSRIDSIKIT